MRTRPIPVVAFLVSGLIGLLALPAVATAVIVIDDYTTGAHTLFDPTPGAGTEYATQSGLPVSNVAGGVRHLELFSFAPNASISVGGGAMSLSTANTSTYFTIHYNGNPSGPGATPALNLNLSQMSAFELTFSRVDRPINFTIHIRSGTINTTSSMLTATAPAVIQAPFTLFGNHHLVNWSDIDNIYLASTASYVGGSTAHTETITLFTAVPEPVLPGAAMLLLMSWVGRRRR